MNRKQETLENCKEIKSIPDARPFKDRCWAEGPVGNNSGDLGRASTIGLIKSCPPSLVEESGDIIQSKERVTRTCAPTTSHCLALQ